MLIVAQIDLRMDQSSIQDHIDLRMLCFVQVKPVFFASNPETGAVFCLVECEEAAYGRSVSTYSDDPTLDGTMCCI